MCYCPTPTLHLNLALTGDGAFIFSLKKTHSVWFISVLNYGDTENVLINHLLLVIPMSYPCHYTNLCPHKPHKHAHTHTHTHTHNLSCTSSIFNTKWRICSYQLYIHNMLFYLEVMNMVLQQPVFTQCHNICFPSGNAKLLKYMSFEVGLYKSFC